MSVKCWDGTNVKFVLLLLLLVLVSCTDNSSLDAQRLDELSSRPTSVDTVMLFSTTQTNYLRGQKAAEFLGMLVRTNRVKASAGGKMETVRWIKGVSGTNQVFFLNVFENGVLSYGDYDFNVKTSLPTP